MILLYKLLTNYIGVNQGDDVPYGLQRDIFNCIKSHSPNAPIHEVLTQSTDIHRIVSEEMHYCTTFSEPLGDHEVMAGIEELLVDNKASTITEDELIEMVYQLSLQKSSLTTITTEE